MLLTKKKLKQNKMIYTLENIFEESLKDNPVKYSKILRAADKWKSYKLEKAISFKLSNGHFIEVPQGFEYDRSSVPRIFWAILPPDGDFDAAALIHDYLYQDSSLVIQNWFGGKKRKAQKFADKEMLAWSQAVNGTRKISLMRIDNYTRYIGVRLFGWTQWNTKKK